MNERIAIDPKICHGKPVIRGTRTPVTVILNALAGGDSFETLQREYSDSLFFLDPTLADATIAQNEQSRVMETFFVSIVHGTSQQVRSIVIHLIVAVVPIVLISRRSVVDISKALQTNLIAPQSVRETMRVIAMIRKGTPFKGKVKTAKAPEAATAVN